MNENIRLDGLPKFSNILKQLFAIFSHYVSTERLEKINQSGKIKIYYL